MQRLSLQKMPPCKKSLQHSNTHLTAQDAASHIKAGGIIACPTEAVWGLSCDPFNQQAVEKLLALKQREQKKGLIVIFNSFEQLLPFLQPISVSQQQQLQSGSKNPITWLVPIKANSFGHWVTGEHQYLAARISSHPFLQQLTKSAGPVISTSANPATLVEAKTAEQVIDYFADEVAICQGELGNEAKPSTIKNLLTQEVLRA